ARSRGGAHRSGREPDRIAPVDDPGEPRGAARRVLQRERPARVRVRSPAGAVRAMDAEDDARREGLVDADSGTPLQIGDDAELRVERGRGNAGRSHRSAARFAARGKLVTGRICAEKYA